MCLDRFFHTQVEVTIYHILAAWFRALHHLVPRLPSRHPKTPMTQKQMNIWTTLELEAQEDYPRSPQTWTEAAPALQWATRVHQEAAWSLLLPLSPMTPPPPTMRLHHCLHLFHKLFSGLHCLPFPTCSRPPACRTLCSVPLWEAAGASSSRTAALQLSRRS